MRAGHKQGEGLEVNWLMNQENQKPDEEEKERDESQVHTEL
jgi:hypothetical protein